tara:strand:- start:839 stop:1303 length:465 start_codon:yes stop_codon:yes gene_type:complete
MFATLGTPTADWNPSLTAVTIVLQLFDGNVLKGEVDVRLHLFQTPREILPRLLRTVRRYFRSSRNHAGYWELSIDPDPPPANARNTTDTYHEIGSVPYGPVLRDSLVLCCLRHSHQDVDFIGPIQAQNHPVAETPLGLYRLRTGDRVSLRYRHN